MSKHSTNYLFENNIFSVFGNNFIDSIIKSFLRVFRYKILSTKRVQLFGTKKYIFVALSALKRFVALVLHPKTIGLFDCRALFGGSIDANETLDSNGSELRFRKLATNGYLCGLSGVVKFE